jgi:hypothetical protein
MASMITRSQADLLAALAADIRPTNASRWDKPGIVAALAKVKTAPLADVAMALIRAATDPEARTPACITNTNSPHWAERITPPGEGVQPPRPSEACKVCGRHGDRCICEVTGPVWRPSSPAHPAAAHEYLMAAKAAIRNAKSNDHQEDPNG